MVLDGDGPVCFFKVPYVFFRVKLTSPYKKKIQYHKYYPVVVV